ncbi:RES family NAD+ phosphorylase [Bosea sp. TAF32]|uniref:RES family NAD+ phosphorylase n=1 Tax=Bosea sp. TAF32 TaxID=3237482 RepID=UPI003F902F1D
MTPQILDRTVPGSQIGNPTGAYPIFDATGSTIAPRRWNTAGSPLIYPSEHFSTALLEKLVHGSGRLQPNQHFIQLTFPKGLSYEVFSPPALPGWDEMPATVSKAFGERWYGERRSAILIVPIGVARLYRNILVNPAHPDSRAIEASLLQPVFWDRWLFAA